MEGETETGIWVGKHIIIRFRMIGKIGINARIKENWKKIGDKGKNLKYTFIFFTYLKFICLCVFSFRQRNKAKPKEFLRAVVPVQRVTFESWPQNEDH